MPKLAGQLSGLGENFRGERGQFVAILFVTGKGKHLGTQAHELDAILVVPANHFDDIPRVGQAELLNILLSQGLVGRLVLVGPVLGRMLGLRGVLQGVAVLQYG